MAVGLGVWLTGCGAPRYEGTWSGKRTLEGPAHIVNTAGALELTLQSNGRYTLLIHSLPVEGSYEVRDGKILLTPRVVGGRDIIPSPPGAQSLMGEGAYLVPEGKDMMLHDVNGPYPAPFRLTAKPAANRSRNP